MENNKLEKVYFKNRTCYYFHDIIKLEDLDDILIDENSCKKYFDLWYFI